MSLSTKDQEMLLYFNQLDELQQLSLIELVRSFLSRQDDPFYSVTTVEQYLKDLDNAGVCLEAGEYYAQHVAAQGSKDWY